jgi:CO/xanthine dehydrogenase Mo-binding subunit
MIVGKTLPRKDAWEKANGKSIYSYDTNYPNALHLSVIRSPFPHARINKIHIDHNMLREHNVTIGTARDIPGKNIVRIVFDDMPLLAEKVVKYVGQPVAVLISKTQKAAKLAESSIKIEYEPLPSIFDPLIAKDHSEVHIFQENNVSLSWRQKRGNPELGFAGADVIVEEEYKTHAQEHAYLEPQGCIAVPCGKDEITIYASTQGPYSVRKNVSEILDYPLSKVTVKQTTIGGAFGGKNDDSNQIACLAAFGAYLTKRPVKLLLSRREDLETTSKRHPAVLRAKTGASKDGLLTAYQVEYFLNTGAFATIGPSVLSKGAKLAAGPYNIKNIDINAYCVNTNLVPFGAFRGFGAPQVHFACEEQMDRLADRLGMDPIVFRMKNIIRQGDKITTGQLIDHSAGMQETLQVAREKSHWREKWKPAPNLQDVLVEAKNGKHIWNGIGVSASYYALGFGASGKSSSRTSAYVQLELDGGVVFSVGTVEMGQGMITVLAQIIAEELGVDYEGIHMASADTSRVPDSGPTVASRTTMFSGRAVQNACRKLRALMFDAVAEKRELSQSNLRIEGHHIVNELGQHVISVGEAIKLMHDERVQVSAAGWDVAPDTYYDYEKGEGKPNVAYVWGTNIVEVEVDVRTGVCEVTDVWAVHDVGKAINPQTVEGQIEGGVLQGLGYGRFEEVLFSDNGAVLTNSLGTYMIPSFLDAPRIHSFIVEDPWNEGPYGAKGIGELPLVGVAPALTNAIFNAVGVRINEIPVTPERLWKAIHEDVREEVV